MFARILKIIGADVHIWLAPLLLSDEITICHAQS